ncbi:MAG: M3 family peptidase, partial [Thermosynechococcaceae cyanobacterium]
MSTNLSNTAAIAANPLLIGKGLPPFDQIAPEQVVPAMTQLMADLDTSLTQLETTVQPTWEGLVEPLQALEERLRWSWGMVGHLMGVKNSPELREAYETVQPQVVEFYNRLGQSRPLYEAFKAIQASEGWATLDPAQQRIVDSSIRSAQLAGVGLEGDARSR